MPACGGTASPEGRPSSSGSPAASPTTPSDFNLLYLGSTSLPRDLEALLLLSPGGGASQVVVNQDGVAYPGWAGEDDRRTEPPATACALHAADHVLFQSRFSKESSDLFLGEPEAEWEILYNAVDVDRFTPAANVPPGGPALLLAGDQTQAYRLELAVRTFAPCVRGVSPRPACSSPAGSSRRWNRCSTELGMRERVELSRRIRAA